MGKVATMARIGNVYAVIQFNKPRLITRVVLFANNKQQLPEQTQQQLYVVVFVRAVSEGDGRKVISLNKMVLFLKKVLLIFSSELR